MGRAWGNRGRVVLVHEHVTGGGLAGADMPASWASEGSAIRRAVAADFASLPRVRVVMTLDDRLPDEPGPWTVARVSPGASIARLASEADSTGLIAPETGGVLRDLTTSIARAGRRSLGSTPDAVDLAADKLRLSDCLRRLEIPSPESVAVRPRLGLPRDFDYPAVLKPIDGAGSLETYLVESPDDPIAASFPPEVGLLCRFVPGEPRSATFLARPGVGPLLIGVGRQDMSRTGGRFAYLGGSILDEPLPLDHPARRAIAAVPGLRGLVGVDYIHDRATGRATVVEINPRPTTSVVGLVAALGPGRLAAAWLDADAVPQPDETRPLARPGSPLSFHAGGTVPSPAVARAQR